jgi:hypothetical protein
VDAARPEELLRVNRGDHSPLLRDWFLHFARNGTALELFAEDVTALSLGTEGGSERVVGCVD